MSVSKVGRSLFVLAVLGMCSTAAMALQVGLTFQAHQDIRDPNLWPNDFHVQGMICSPGYPPILVDHIDGQFPYFTWNCTPTGDPGWYEFEATWWLPTGRYIGYCDLIRLGLLVDVDVKNIIINTTAWWTRDGVPVGQKSGSLYNDGYYPVLGFNVEDYGEPQYMTLANGIVDTAPATKGVGPSGAAAIKIDVLSMDVITMDTAPAIKDLVEGGAQESWKWISVAQAGTVVSPTTPVTLAPGTSVDLVLDGAGTSDLAPTTPVRVVPGGFLVSRQQIGFTNNSGEYEIRYSFEVHGSQAEEACCFADGTCQMWQPFTCLERGGTAMGEKTMCDGEICQSGGPVTPSKWLQPPDLAKTGIDVQDTKPLMLADDWLCTQSNAITHIHVWGSWRQDQLPYNPANAYFTLAIHADVPDPDGSGPAYSMPGNILWTKSYQPYSYTASVYAQNIVEGFWNPAVAGSYILPGDTVCYLYEFDVPATEAFCQQGSSSRPIVYWLSIQATMPATPLPYKPIHGWKTSTRHWNDDAVFCQSSSGGVTPWRELRYPTGHPYAGQSVDLAFELIPTLCIAPPTDKE